MKYTILKGWHYHINLLMRAVALVALYPRKEVKKIVTFPVEAYYKENVIVHSGYNKLFGGGAWDHHETSARFVWLPDYDKKNEFRVFSYVYEYGKWDAEYLFNVVAEKEVALSISITEQGYQFSYGRHYFTVKHHDPKLRRMLQPYHGGEDKAYKTYSIKLS